MGKVYIPSYAPWFAEARDQLMKFPYGAHDDFVDALAYIGLGLAIQVKPRTARPAGPTTSVGTLGWVKEQSRAQDRERQIKFGGW